MGAWIAGIGALLTVITNVMFIPSMGYMGSAYAVLLCFVIMTVISYIVGQKYYKVDYELKRILVYIGISVGFYYLSSFIHFSISIFQYLLNFALFSGFIVIVFFAEKKDLRSLLKL
jgi:O-antigen/teichoic acid export membrane protein